MILGKVTSRVVATARLKNLPEGQYLIVEPEPGYKCARTPIIAIDSVSAGPGDRVLVMQEGTGARQCVLEQSDQTLPAHSVVVGVVDDVQLS